MKLDDIKAKAIGAFKAVGTALHNHVTLPKEDRDMMISEGMNPNPFGEDPTVKEREAAARRCEGGQCPPSYSRHGRGG